jgi:hypothetical protein
MSPVGRAPADAQEYGRFAAVGNVLEAEVLTAAGRQLTLRLPDGAVVSARSETVLQASPGDTLWLTVSGQSDGTLLVKAADGRPDARSLLHQWKAGQTPQNVRLVSAMLNAGLPPAERLFRWLASALVSIPDITPEQAVFLRAHNIPLDKQSVAFLNRMSRQDLMLGRQLIDLIDLLFPAADMAGRADAPLAGRAAVGQASASTGAANVLRGIAPGSATEAPPAVPETNPVPPAPAAAERISGGAVHREAISPHTAASLETEILAIFGRGAAADPAGGTGLPGVVNIDTLRAMIRAVANDPAAAPWPADRAEPAPPAAAAGAAVRPTGTMAVSEADADAAAPRPPAAPAPEGATAIGRIPADLARIVGTFGTAGTAGAAGTVKPLYVPEAAKTGMANGAARPPGAPDKTDAPPLRAALTGLFRDIRPEQADELPRAMDADLARRLLDTLHAAGEEAAARPPAERVQAEAALRDIAAGVRFTQQLGNFAAVVQWPVTLNGQETTAELYVFGDDGAHSRLDPKNATLFLSLNTAHMGRVEALVKVIGKHVECDFRLPSKEQADLARTASPKLGALLTGVGYRLTRSSFIQLLEPAAGPLAVAEARAFFDRRYRFDRQA